MSMKCQGVVLLPKLVVRAARGSRHRLRDAVGLNPQNLRDVGACYRGKVVGRDYRDDFMAVITQAQADS